MFSLLAAPPIGFVAIALRPNPREIWSQSWPAIAFAGLYQIALDQCVDICGLEHLPMTGPVILAGNHINRTALDGMLLGSKILLERGIPAKWVSIPDPPTRLLKHFVRLMGKNDGVLLPIRKGATTSTMIEFLKNPQAFGRSRALLGIFPAGEADRDFERQINKPWHTGAAVASIETGTPIVPFFVEGLPYHWGPLDMLKAVGRCLIVGKAFGFKVRLGAPILPESVNGRADYIELTDRLREAVRRLAADASSGDPVRCS